MSENRKKFEKAYIKAITKVLGCEEIRLEQLIFYSEKMMLVLDFGVFRMHSAFEYSEKDSYEKALFEVIEYVIKRLENYKARMVMFSATNLIAIIEKVINTLMELMTEDIESRLDDFVKMLGSKREREIYVLYWRWGYGIVHESCSEGKNLKRIYEFLLVNGCEVWLKGECNPIAYEKPDEVDEW